jgi:hypothetical protein|tara:strand:+ start:1894 stop:2625 length:732 start_codon:yes stop_codon:yes gene_type:complete
MDFYLSPQLHGGLKEMNRFRSVFLFIAVLILSMQLSSANMHEWESKPQIVWVANAQGETVLTITFDFSEKSDPPSNTLYPSKFQIRTSLNGVDWTELDHINISPRPTTTFFNVTYNLGSESKPLHVQARLEENIPNVHGGWSEWSDTFTVVPGDTPNGGAAQVENTVTKTVTTTSTSTQITTTTVTRATTNLLTTTLRETLTKTTTSTFTDEVPITGSSDLTLLGAGIAIAGIAIAIALTRRK